MTVRSTAVWCFVILLPAFVAATSASVTEGRVTGEVVESSCYVRSGARGESHRKCAELCARGGIPLAILDEREDRIVWIAAEDHTRSANETLMPWIARKVTVSGRWIERSGVRMLVLESIAAADGRPPPREAK